jgi:hypothetical protein
MRSETRKSTEEAKVLAKPIVWFGLAVLVIGVINLTINHEPEIRDWVLTRGNQASAFAKFVLLMAYSAVILGPIALLFACLANGIRLMRKGTAMRKLVWVGAVWLLAVGTARAQEAKPETKPDTKSEAKSAETKAPVRGVKKVAPPKAHRVRPMPRGLDMELGVPEVYTAPSYATAIELPEPVVQFAEGDAKKWVIACGQGVRPGVDAGGKSLCVVKPGRPDERLSTSLIVTGASGSLYPFHLVPASDEIDLVTFVKAPTRHLVASAEGMDPNVVPKSELAAALSGERQALAQVSELKDSLETERLRAAALVDPQRMAFDYQLDRGVWKKGPEAAMFEDGERTFLLTTGTPVIRSGEKELLPVAPCGAGKMCVFGGVLQSGYFAVGGHKTKFTLKKVKHA